METALKDSIKVLLVEDSEDDYFITREHIAKIESATYELEWVSTYKEALEIMAQNQHDIYLLDYLLGKKNGLELFRQAVSLGCNAPVIFLTAYDLHQVDIEAMSTGAVDYLVKEQINTSMLERSIRYAIKRHRSQTNLRNIIEQNADGVLLVDKQGCVRFLNPAAESLFGQKAEELVGTHFEIPLMADETTEMTIPRRDNKKVIAEMRVVEIEWEEENVLMASMRDITERKQMEINLRLAKEAAEEASTMKSEFLANMSHEIRTPMNSILGFSEILQNYIRAPQPRQYLETIQLSGKSLLKLINDILDLSKIEAGKLELEYSDLHLPTLFREIEQIFTYGIAKKGLEFHLEIAPDLTQILWLDETRLRQVLLNLVGNAIKFTDSGYIKLRAYKRPSSEGSRSLELIIDVEDTGIGIPEDQVHEIFDYFVQSKCQNHAQYGGTGLGLSITKRLLNMMHGKIDVVSKEDKGSIFRIILEGVKVASSKNLQQTEEDQLDIKTITFEPANILIVDDNQLNREVLRIYLSHFNFHIIDAENGQQALDLAQQEQPDLIIMDLKMPIMDGYQATLKLKEDDSLKHIPIIILTALATKDSEKQLRGISNSYLTRPISQKELIVELTKFLPHTILSPSTETGQPSAKSETMLNLDESALQKLPELMQIIEEEVLPIWQNRMDFSINETEALGNKCKNLGIRYQYSPLMDWGESLRFHTSMFNMDEINKSLEALPTLVDTLQDHIHKKEVCS